MCNPTKIEEIWKDVPGYEGLYQVSNLGKVKGLPRTVRRGYGSFAKLETRFLGIRKNSKSGYAITNLRDRNGKKRTVYLHSILLLTFVGPCPKGHLCRHLDDNRCNNKLENLAYGTYLDNWKDAVRNGLASTGEKRHNAKLTKDQVIEIRKTASEGTIHREIAERFGVERKHICDIVNGKKWRYI